jgi:hypothetical protein
MDSDNFIESEEFEENNFSDSQFQKFRLLAYEFFDKERNSETDYLKCVKENAKLYSFTLPPYMIDILILFDEAPFFWLTDSPFVLGVEEFFKRQYSKIYDPDNIKAIKGFYMKWAIQKEPNTKSYFAKSALALLDKNPQKNNFIFAFYKGTILTFEILNNNLANAEELFVKTKDLVSSLELKQSLKDEALYLISIYSAFAYLKEGDLYKAGDSFMEALTYKESGVTAKFYLAYLSAVQKNDNDATKLLQDIFLGDINKVQYAISVNSINLMSYFMLNAACVKFFDEREFQSYAPFLRELFAGVKKTEPEFIDALNNRLHILHELGYEEYYDKEINDIIPFIGKTFQTFKGSKNILLLATADKLIAKFDRIYEIIYAAISKKLFGQMKEDLRPYDSQIAENAEKMRLLEAELDAIKSATTEEHNAEIKVIEEKAAANIKEVEILLNDSAIDKKFNPQAAFSNSMFYNLIVSFAVFILAGLASYSNASNSEGGDFKGFFGALMIGGTKWGTITFLIGIIVSIFASISVILEKSNFKQKMQNRISALRSRREKDIEILKQNYSMRIKMIEQNYNNRIDSAKKAEESFNAEREAQEQKIKEKIDEELKAEEAKLRMLI